LTSFDLVLEVLSGYTKTRWPALGRVTDGFPLIVVASYAAKRSVLSACRLFGTAPLADGDR